MKKIILILFVFIFLVIKPVQSCNTGCKSGPTDCWCGDPFCMVSTFCCNACKEIGGVFNGNRACLVGSLGQCSGGYEKNIVGICQDTCHPYLFRWADTDRCPSSASWEGQSCQIKGGWYCDWGTTGVWDVTDNTGRKCIKCNGGIEEKIYGDTNAIYTSGNDDTGAISGDNKCESACGAPSNCDEVTPGTNGCSLACTTSISTTSTTTTAATTTTSISTSTTTTSTSTTTISTSTTSTTTTTTTVPPAPIIYNIQCSGSTNYDCTAPDASIDSINSITVPPSAKCGDTVNIAVQWTGYHLGDSNHWGFFINNGGQFIHVGDCTSFVSGDAQHTSYNMSCYVKMPNPEDINNGIYEFWVTGSDAKGYCNPGDPGTHVESFVPITLTNCLYTAPCSQCPKRVTPDECRVVCNNPNEPNPIITRCKCQSLLEWYLYDVTSSNFEVWINAIPTSYIDISLNATSDKTCPITSSTTSSNSCFNDTGGPGQTEMCHLKLGEMDSPQYFLVNKLSGPSYDQTNYYDIILTCKPDPSDTGSSSQGMLQSVPPPATDEYYKIINPIPGKTVSVTLTPTPSAHHSGNDYNLYLSKSPGLYPFAEKSGTKNYVCYGDKVGYNGKEKCTFTVPNSGDYYYLAHHVRGGYGYDIKWDYSCPGDIDGNIVGGYKTVQLSDLVNLAVAYGSKPGDSKWNPDADLNADYNVNLMDLVNLATHYGWKYDTQCNFVGYV